MFELPGTIALLLISRLTVAPGGVEGPGVSAGVPQATEERCCVLAQATEQPKPAPNATDLSTPKTVKRLPTQPHANGAEVKDQARPSKLPTDNSDDRPRPLDGRIDPDNPGGAQDHRD